MSSMKLTKNSFTINEMKLVDDFNLLCNDLKRFKSLRAKTIFMYERTTYFFWLLKIYIIKN